GVATQSAAVWARTRLGVEVTLDRPAHVGIEPGHGLAQLLERDVVAGAAVVEVLHVLPPLGVERVEDGVLAAVELERLDAEALAELDVERRRRLHPAAVELQLRVAVV